MSFRKGPSPFCLSFAPYKVQAQRYATANSPPQTVSFRFVKGHSQRCTGVQRAFQPRAKLAMSDSGTENRFSRTALGFSVSHAAFFRFDCRDCQRPAPAGRVTRARGSLAFSEVETGIAAIKTRTAVPFFAGVSHCEETYRTLLVCEYNDDGTSAVSTNTIFSHEHEDNCSPKIAPLGTHLIYYG